MLTQLPDLSYVNGCFRGGGDSDAARWSSRR